MRKSLAPFLTAISIIVAGIVAFMAFESYTLDINAHLEPALSVNPHGDWDLGTVYPETTRTTKLFVGLSNSAKDDTNLLSVEYDLSCQSKPSNPEATQNLCPHISVDDQQVAGAVFTCPQPPDLPNPCKYVTRRLTATDQPHGYGIKIEFPDCEDAHQKETGVKEIDCEFDRGTGKFEGVDLAAQISVQVTDIEQTEKCITRKDGTELPSCVKTPPPDGTPTITATPEEATATPTATEEPTITPTPGDGLKHEGGATRRFDKAGTAPNGDPFDCAYDITFQGVSIELNGFMWSYFVESVPGQDGPRCGLSHWSIGLCQKAQDSLEKSDPPAIPSADIKGITWEDISESGDFVSGKFTFTLTQNLPVNRDPGVEVAFKFDNINLLLGNVEGPECPPG